MNRKKLAIMAGAAVVLGICALLLDGKSAMRAPGQVGKKLISSLDWSAISRIEMGGASNRFAVAVSDGGWVIESLFGYPASESKIRHNLLSLQECTVGDVSERKFANASLVDIQNASGKSLFALTLGDKRMGSANPAFPYASARADGRYVRVGGGEDALLVGDALEAFDGGVSDWADVQIASVDSSALKTIMFIDADGKDVRLVKKDAEWTLSGLGTGEQFDSGSVYSSESALSHLDFSSVADPKLGRDVTGLARPKYFSVQAKDGCTYTAQIGNKTASGDWYVSLVASFSAAGTNAVENAAALQKVKDFNGRNEKWIYLVSDSSVSPMLKKRSDFIKKEETENKGN